MFKFTVKCTGSRFAIYCTRKVDNIKKLNVAACIFSQHCCFPHRLFSFFPTTSFAFHIYSDKHSRFVSLYKLLSLPAKWEKGRCTVWSNDDVGKMMLLAQTHKNEAIHSFSHSFWFFLLILVLTRFRVFGCKLKWGKMCKGNCRFSHKRKIIFTKEPIL